MKPRTFLRDENISDEKLLLELNIAACEEAERQAKFTPKKQVSFKLSSVETASSEFSHKSKKERKQKNELAATVQLLEAIVATLTRAVNYLKANQKNDKTECPALTNKTSPTSNNKVCPACQDTGSTSCNHGFICLSDDHFVIGCNMAPKHNNPGNRRRPHP